MSAPPLPEIFGNYVIKGISEVIPPDSVSWLPSAPAWRLLAVAAAAYLIWYAIGKVRHWWRNRYRREACRQLNLLTASDPAPVQNIAVLLKATALQARPRSEVARLSGQDWVSWLNRQAPAAFSTGSAELLGSTQYRAASIGPDQFETLRQECRNWIMQHQDSGNA